MTQDSTVERVDPELVDPQLVQPQLAQPQLVQRWRDLLARHAEVSCALEKELQSRHQIGLSEFEVLDRLVETDCGELSADPCRMSELTQNIHLSQSALSRAVARLEREGLVERSMCAADRRSIFVCLTESGRAAHAAAEPTHREILGRTLH